jgi:hypothetical protein
MLPLPLTIFSPLWTSELADEPEGASLPSGKKTIFSAGGVVACRNFNLPCKVAPSLSKPTFLAWCESATANASRASP